MCDFGTTNGTTTVRLRLRTYCSYFGSRVISVYSSWLPVVRWWDCYCTEGESKRRRGSGRSICACLLSVIPMCHIAWAWYSNSHLTKSKPWPLIYRKRTSFGWTRQTNLPIRSPNTNISWFFGSTPPGRLLSHPPWDNFQYHSKRTKVSSSAFGDQEDTWAINFVWCLYIFHNIRKRHSLERLFLPTSILKSVSIERLHCLDRIDYTLLTMNY